MGVNPPENTQTDENGREAANSNIQKLKYYVLVFFISLLFEFL
jgi:hypothetical protein